MIRSATQKTSTLLCLQAFCFLSGGMYALGAKTLKNAYEDDWMKIGEGITNTCHESYDRTDTKLGPEAFRFSDAVEARAIKSTERYYILRPETFESYFVLWRLTHDQKYRDWGWEAVQVRNFANITVQNVTVACAIKWL